MDPTRVIYRKQLPWGRSHLGVKYQQLTHLKDVTNMEKVSHSQEIMTCWWVCQNLTNATYLLTNHGIDFLQSSKLSWNNMWVCKCLPPSKSTGSTSDFFQQSLFLTTVCFHKRNSTSKSSPVSLPTTIFHIFFPVLQQLYWDSWTIMGSLANMCTIGYWKNIGKHGTWFAIAIACR